MKIKRLLLLVIITAPEQIRAESWGSIGSTITGFGSSVWDGMRAMAEGFIGKTPSGYNYNFQVFNDSQIPVYIKVAKAKNLMGARFSVGGGDSVTIAPDTDSGSAFHSESLYFAVKMSGPGLSYEDDHYQLGQKDDPTIYYYHVFSNKDSGTPQAECLGGGYTTSPAFSCRIENKLSTPIAVTFTISSSLTPGITGTDTRTMTVSDVDPQCFTYLQPPQTYSMNGSSLQFASSQSSSKPTLTIQKNLLAQTTSAAGAKTQTTSPVTYNYVANLSSGTLVAYKTGLGPGNFDQPQNSSQLRDISPVACHISYQSADQAGPIGSLLPHDIAWESVWYFYSGYGWSQQQEAVISTPCNQIPNGSTASCFVIRPSVAFYQQQGPGRLVIARLNIPAAASVQESAPLAQQFFTKMMNGQLQIEALSNAMQGGQIIDQANVSQVALVPAQNSFLSGGVTYPVPAAFSLSNPFVVYPSLSATQCGGTVQIDQLTFLQKSQLLSLELPDSVGLLKDQQSGVSGYIMITDSLLPYGMGSGPCYYTVLPPYLDLSAMLSCLVEYVGMCNYGALTSSVFSQIQQVLAQVVIGWVSHYYGQPQAVIESIASFLVLIGQNKVSTLLEMFGSAKNSVPTIPGALMSLSPQGRAFLKLLTYGPCSITQLPVYYKAGSSSLQQPPNASPVTINL